MTFEHAILAAWLAASAADGGTTLLGMREGAREMNPVFATPAALVVGKAAIGTAGVMTVHHWEKDHPKLVRVIGIAATVGYSALAFHNWQAYRDLRDRR